MKKKIALFICLVLMLTGCVISLNPSDGDDEPVPEKYGSLLLNVTLKNKDEHIVQNVDKLVIIGTCISEWDIDVEEEIPVESVDPETDEVELSISLEDLVEGFWEFEITVMAKPEFDYLNGVMACQIIMVEIKSEETATDHITIKLGLVGEPTSLNPQR